LDATGVRRELVASKTTLDEALGQATTELGLPGGDAPRRGLRRLVTDAGYEVVAGSRWGVNHDDGESGGADRPLRRCTVRGHVDAATARRMIHGDPRMALARWPREVALARIRSTLGATRYARWRRRLLDVIPR
jgi:hypothetical protein